jgi:hypothetical protein
MAEVMECGPDPAPLHLKIVYHHKRVEAGHVMLLQLSDMKMVLMPRLRLLLTQLDPEGLYEFNSPQMRELIRPHTESIGALYSGTSCQRTWMSRALSRSIAISNCSEPLHHGVIILCPARAKRTLGIASVGHHSLRVSVRSQGASAEGICRSNRVREETMQEMQENWQFGWQEEEACPGGVARRREGDAFKGFALGGDAASGRRGGTIATGQSCGLYRT